MTATQPGNSYYQAAYPVVDSFVISATQAPAPAFSRRGSSLQTGALIRITDAAPVATIYFTMDGSIPATDGSNPSTIVAAAPAEAPVTGWV